MSNNKLRQIIFVFCLLLCALPQVDTAMALILGVLLSMSLGNPWPQQSARSSKIILQLSVVGLGFGLSLGEVLQTGKSSLLFTIIGISGTLLVGLLLGRLFKVGPNTSLLVSFGTAICGGSAIAAMSPVIKAENEETAVSLATVFLLNAVALLLFPAIGHLLSLDQTTFGTWAGLAIHDTSSVVGAASVYGAQALAVGTTVKLTRAIWITPVVLIVAKLKNSGSRTGVPLFIIGFIIAAALRSLLPQLTSVWSVIALIAKQALVITLFLIGTGLSREVLKKVGIKPLLQGISLWLLVSSITLISLLAIGLV